MRDKWVRYLVDCKTKQPLKLKVAQRDGEFVSSGVLESTDGKCYNIVEGIPRFVRESFYIDTDVKSDEIQVARSFGSKWRATPVHWGMRGNEADIEFLRRIFYRLLNIERKAELKDLFKDGTNCLNAGCGVAWCEYLFNSNPQSNRFAVDMSTSIEPAYKFTKDFDNVCVLQANILNTLPFKYDFFDIIICDGVLHHMKDARQGFSALCAHLKPGGLIGIYIYCLKPFIRENVDRLLRDLTTRMTFDECKDFSDQMTMLGKSFSEVKGHIQVSKDIPILGIKKGRYKVQEFIYKHIVKCWYNENLGYDTSVMVNVDWYHPRYATHHNKEEISQWFYENGIEDINFRQPEEWEYSGYFVSGRKKRSG